MQYLDREASMILTITDIRDEDGLVQFKDKLIGMEFNAFLTTTSVGHPNWYMIAGTFVKNTGITSIDQATNEKPVVISMAQYTI